MSSSQPYAAGSTNKADHKQIRASAQKLGNDLFDLGLTIDEVVHEYGDLCQIVTELVSERKLLVPADEFRIMNLCLDEAIAAAVTEYAQHRERSINSSGTGHAPTTAPGSENFGQPAHELRNLIATARAAFDAIRCGQVGPDGATGTALDQSLVGLSDLVERTFANVPTPN